MIQPEFLCYAVKMELTDQKNTGIKTEVESILSRTQAHDKERDALIEILAEPLNAWIALHFGAGLMTRSTATRWFGYLEAGVDSIIFYAPPHDSYGSRGDDEDLPETYLSIPVDFIAGNRQPYIDQIRKTSDEPREMATARNENKGTVGKNDWPSLGEYP